MGLNPIAILGAIAALGGALGAGALSLAGAPGAAAAIGGLIAACGAAATGQIWRQESERQEIEAALAEARGDVIALAERQARAEAKMAEIERRTIESPALVWRAATADIEVLGSLVSNLAQAVAEHERRLAPPAIAAAPAAPAPDLFEDEAELGFTADVPAAEPTRFVPASPAVIVELKTTLAAALASDRLELCLQPVVALPQRRVRGYEATLRLRGEAGDLQGDADLRRIAVATGLEPAFDRALVERSVQVLRILRARSREASALCAINAASLRSEEFRGVVEAMARADATLIGAVTLEIAEAEFRALDAEALEAMRGLAAKGVAFGVGRLSRPAFDAEAAVSVGVRQARIDAETLLAALRDPVKADGQRADIHPADLAEFLRRRGIDLLVAGVGAEQTVLDILELGAPLALGALFGEARPVRPEVLEPKAVATAAEVERPAAERQQAERQPAERPAEEPAPAGAPRAQRQSFRSMLRRA